jgi:hypothetical protein
VCLKNTVEYLVEQNIKNKFQVAFILCVFAYVNVQHLQARKSTCTCPISLRYIFKLPDSFTWFHPSTFPTTATYAIISRHMCQFPTHLMPQTLHNIMVNMLLPVWARMQTLWGYETKFASVYPWVALHLYSLELQWHSSKNVRISVTEMFEGFLHSLKPAITVY